MDAELYERLDVVIIGVLEYAGLDADGNLHLIIDTRNPRRAQAFAKLLSHVMKREIWMNIQKKKGGKKNRKR